MNNKQQKRVIFVILTLVITGLSLAFIPRTALNHTGYQLSSGWHTQVNTSLPAGAVCDRAFILSGFPLTTVRPDYGGYGCDDSINNTAKVLNFFTILLLACITAGAVVTILFRKAQS